MGTVGMKRVLGVLFSVVLVLGLAVPSTLYAQTPSDDGAQSSDVTASAKDGVATLSNDDFSITITDVDGDYDGDWSVTSKKSDSKLFKKAVASDAFKDLNGNKDESFLFNVSLKDGNGTDISDEFSGNVTLKVDYTAAEYTLLALSSNGTWSQVKKDVDTTKDDNGDQTSLTFTTDNPTDFLVVTANDEKDADDEAVANAENSSTTEAKKADNVSNDNDSSSDNKSLDESNSGSTAEGGQGNDGELKTTASTAKDITAFSLPTDNKQTVRWTYSSSSYTEFYVTSYDKATESELSFDLDYSVTDSSEEVTIDLTDLTSNVSHVSDGTNAYEYSYATVYGIDNSDNSNKSDESYWQTLGSAGQPITKLVITHTQMSGYAMWGYEAYSGDDLLGTINVRAHDNSTYPYIYLQLWCDEIEPLNSDNKQTVRWTYGNNVYTEFYVTAYDEATKNELSFDIDYSREETANEIEIDLSDLTSNVTNINDGTYAYDYVYATVYGIDYSEESHRSDASYWQTLGSADQPVTKLVLTYGSSISGSRLWGYSAYSGDTELGHIDVLAHDDSTHPYIYLQLWCSQGDALPVVAKNVNTGVEYTQLDTAIDEASAEDTVQLLDNIDVAVTKTNEFSIDKNLTLDLNKKAITASCSNNSYRLFNIASGVAAIIKNGTIDGGDSQALGNAIYGNGASADLTDVTLDGLTIQNFGASSNYGTVYVYDGSLSATNCTFSNNGNSAINLRSSAGDANLYDGTALTLDSCTISGNTNSTNNYGGGVGIRQIAKANITNCTVTGNKFESEPSGIYGGGGIVLYNVGEITLDKNTITGNESSMYGGGILILSGSAFNLGDKTTISNNTITNNTAHSNGGGLAYYINAETHADEAYCTFTGNTIDNNYSYTRGGGMSMYSNDPDFVFTIYSGTVNNNKANDSGGGIDFAWERPATLQLYSTVITENIAAKGGGVWLCPTSETRMYVTFGGAIYGNEASESVEETEPCGDEIRFEGDSDGDDYTGMVVNIAPRALGGTLMDWYTDEYGARYNDGLGTLIDVTSAEYTDRTEEFSVHGELSESGIVLAKDEATTVISGNEAEQGNGGGIASNAVLVFGEDTTTEVSVTKEWKDENGNILTDGLPANSVDVTLVRVDENGNKADLETVTLNKKSGWTWTFKDLPTNYTYEVRENTKVEGYAPSYNIEKNDEGNYVAVITNAPGKTTPGNPNPDRPDTGNPTPTSHPNGNNPNSGGDNPNSGTGSSGSGDNGTGSAKTGDTTPLLALLVVALVAAGVGTTAGVRMYRNNHKNGLHKG